MIIYKATNQINGKIYIGQSQKSLKNRIKGHVVFSNNNNYGVFQKAIKKYGVDNFRWQVICICPDIDSLNEREQYYIAFYDSMNNGYNRTSGGINYKMSDETREKLKQSNLSRMKLKTTMKQIPIQINNNVWQKLLAIKERTGNSLVSIIRVAIDEFLKLQQDNKQ